MNSKILADAADHIAHYGFTQGRFVEKIYEDAEGHAVSTFTLSGARRPRDPSQCPCCPRGAIAVVCGHHPEFPGEPLAWGDPDDPALRAAERALVDYLLDAAGWTPANQLAESYLPDRDPALIEFWADEDGRTQEEVVAVLRAAAQREREAGR